MRRDYALAGFVMTADEWDSLDDLARAQLLAASLRRDGAWDLPVAVPGTADVRGPDAVPEPIDDLLEPYAHYELVLAAA